MATTHMRLFKSKEEIRQHFIERLMERHGIEIDELEYDNLCFNRNFQGLYAKTSNKTMGIININDKPVWVLRDGISDLFVTCYPSDVEQNIDSMFRSAFSIAQRPTVDVIYNEYVKERDSISHNFETDKDAAQYYFGNTMFSALHMDAFKYGKPRNIRVVHQVRSILDGTNTKLRLRVEPIPDYKYRGK